MISPSCLLQTLLLSLSTGCLAASSAGKSYSSFRPEALGPLNKISDWAAFSKDLMRIKAAGVEALATDVWWGQVETADQVFDFSYYDKLSSTVINSGLQWIPILSTHACGGYGQSCNIPVPGWAGLASKESYQSIDIFGNAGQESFSPWAGDYVYKQYGELFTAFAQHFKEKAAYIPRIDLSGGPSGELRYPSYTLNWQYPARGQLQAYSNAAVASFRNYSTTKYGSLAAISKAWSTNLNSINDIRPPCSTTTSPTSFGVCVGQTNADDFFSFGYKSTYGQDFLGWYQDSLIAHSSRLSEMAHAAFDPVFTATESIAIKVAGVHWQYFSPNEPHSAEYTSGYVDYNKLLDALAKQGLEVTFTAIEMDDSNYSPYYSGARSLTYKVFGICKQLGIACGAENALDITSPGGSAYPNMRSALTTFSPAVKSLTFLRYNDLASSLDNLQAYSNYISAIPQPTFALFFKVTGIASNPNQVISIIGNTVELGSNSLSKSFKLVPYDCNGNLCTWIGTAKCSSIATGVPGTTPPVTFSVAIVDQSSPQSSLVQCGSPYQFNPDTAATSVLVNQGTGNYVSNGIRVLQVGNPTVSCPPSSSSSVIVTSYSTSSTTTTLSPSPTSTPSSSGVLFKVSHDTGLGDHLYIVGTFNSWSTCSAVVCTFASAQWTCPLDASSLKVGQKYEWKAMQYGSKTNTACSSPVWASGPNQSFVYQPPVSAQQVVSFSY